ncbi:MAG: hypothetical protein ACE5KM_24645, partial [Planctomycetaceae bacterium]
MSRHCLPVLFALAAAALVFVTTARGQVRLGPRGPVIVRPEPKGSSKSRPRRPAIDRTKPTTFKLTVSPAAEPEPALKYALLPRFEDLKPGNSTPFYYRAILSIKDRPKDPLKPFHDNYDTWMNGPPSQMPRDEVRKFLRGFRNVFHELKIATHREKTDWAWRLKDVTGIQAIAFLLPEVQEARQVARLLILRIRLAIAERRYDDAIASFQMGYQLARDVAEPPTLINDLVGVSIAQMLTAELRNMSGTSGAPNMYWALSKMRRPFIDMEPAMRYEMTLPAKVFPALQDAETADHSPEEWGRILADA